VRRLISLLGLGVVGQVALVLTSPPLWLVGARPGQGRTRSGVARWHDRYGSDLANLAYASRPALPTAMGETLAGCAAVLRPGGLVVLTARPRRRRDLEQALGIVHQRPRQPQHRIDLGGD
jgi:modification methylase